MLPSQIFNRHREEILEIFKRYPMLINLRIFGSVARGEDTEKSDIDFLVDTLPGTTFFNLSGAQFELEKILGLRVHLLTSKELPPKFKTSCLNEAKPI